MSVLSSATTPNSMDEGTIASSAPAQAFNISPSLHTLRSQRCHNTSEIEKSKSISRDVWLLSQYEHKLVMDDVEKDFSFLIEELIALNVFHSSDAVHELEVDVNSSTRDIKPFQVIHNYATEVNLLARAAPQRTSTRSSSRKGKGFMDLPGEIRNLIYGRICDRFNDGELCIRKQRPNYQEISITENEKCCPLAIFEANRQVRREFLAFWLSHSGVSTNNETNITPSMIGPQPSIIITAHMSFSNFEELRVQATFRSFDRDDRARISFMFGTWWYSKLTPSSKDRIAITIAEIFQTNGDITLEKFMLATDSILALSLEALVVPQERYPDSCFRTTFSVEKTPGGEVPNFSTED